MKKRSAIITWVTFPNFGTFLQAYALQQVVLSLGYSNAILDDASVVRRKVGWRYEIKKMLMLLFDTGYRRYAKSCKRANNLFDDFKATNLVVDHEVSDGAPVDAKYDVYICGSDQIWNPYSLDAHDAGFFYATFTDKPKIAYAPSIGVSHVPMQYLPKLRDFTCGFSFLSAREQPGVDILHELTGKDVVRVVDPTLLLAAGQWNALLPMDAPCVGKYVLAYFLSPNSAFINTALAYAKRKGIRLKMFFTDKDYCHYDCDLVTAGPIEFLHYVRNAECLFTDSFHGSVFSCIFHTQFFVFKRFKQTARGQNSRVENLLEMMGESERLLDEGNCGDASKLPAIDFARVEYNLAPFVIKSKEYLEKSLQSSHGSDMSEK